jgi:hypothetical protein
MNAMRDPLADHLLIPRNGMTATEVEAVLTEVPGIGPSLFASHHDGAI